MSDIAVIIPFRLRESGDMRRKANLDVVQAWWYTHGFDPQIVSDGGSGDEQFNRHRAYNDAVSRNPDARVFVFTEADMLIHPDQIDEAIRMARTRAGLVVPFTEYRYLSETVSQHVLDTYYDMPSEDLAEWWGLPTKDENSIFDLRPESVMQNGDSIGAVNVVSRRTLQLTGGFTEATSGNWYDDNIIEEGFAYLTGRATRFVKGPAVHLYHKPGWTGDHLTDADRHATARNKGLLYDLRRYIRQDRRAAVRAMMETRRDR